MKLNLRFKVLIKYQDGTSKYLFPTRKSKLSHNPVLNNFRSAYLKVTYKPRIHNDGTFSNKRDFLNALASWTETELLNFIEEGVWE